MFAQSHVGFAIFDAQLRFVRVNAVVAAMSRRPIEAHRGRTPGELMGVPDTPGERAMRELLRDGRARAVVTLAFEHPDMPGETRDFEATYTVMRDPDGRVLGVSAVVLDITDRQRAEAEREEIRAAAERFGNRALLRAEIGTALESTRGALQRMQRLAELLVPRFADTATVEIDDPVGIRATRTGRGRTPARTAESLAVPLVVRGRDAGHAHRRPRPRAPRLRRRRAPLRARRRRPQRAVDRQRAALRARAGDGAHPAAQPARGGAAHGARLRPRRQLPAHAGRARADRRRLVRRRDAARRQARADGRRRRRARPARRDHDGPAAQRGPCAGPDRRRSRGPARASRRVRRSHPGRGVRHGGLRDREPRRRGAALRVRRASAAARRRRRASDVPRRRALGAARDVPRAGARRAPARR